MALVARASYSSHYDEEEEAFDTSFDYNGSSGSSGVYGADALPVTEACEEGDNGIEADLVVVEQLEAQLANKLAELAQFVISLREHLAKEEVAASLMPETLNAIAQSNQALIQHAERKTEQKAAAVVAAASRATSTTTQKMPEKKACNNENIAPAVAAVAKPAISAFPAPILPLIQQDEFDAIPRYMMKGRVTLQALNASAAKLLQVYEDKYKLMQMHPSKMKDVLRRRHQAYMQWETDETRDFFFVCDDDIKYFDGAFKLDNHGRAVLHLLRQLNRIREVRTKGVCRYVLLS